MTAFHAALAAGDSAAALALLAPDAVVLESGEVETRAEYAAHHLAADIEFSRAVPSQRVVTLVASRGRRRVGGGDEHGAGHLSGSGGGVAGCRVDGAEPDGRWLAHPRDPLVLEASLRGPVSASIESMQLQHLCNESIHFNARMSL